jgi:hypothetical protein
MTTAKMMSTIISSEALAIMGEEGECQDRSAAEIPTKRVSHCGAVAVFFVSHNIHPQIYTYTKYTADWP